MTLGRRRQMLAALVLGVVAALGQAPFYLPVATLLSMVGIIWLIGPVAEPRRVALLGWLFGAGYFAVSLHWIVSPFLVDAPRHGWMAPFALILMAAGAGLFWAAAFGLARWMSRRPWPLILCWPAAEMLRAYIFTGFPWASPAQAMVDVLMGQVLAFVGPYGVTLILVGFAVAVCSASGALVRMALLLGAGLLVVLPPLSEPSALTGQAVRLVQPNAAQHEKWDPDKIPVFFARQLEFTAAPVQAPLSAIIWSETAIPWALERADNIIAQISAAAGNTPVMLGAQRSEEGRYYNALAVIGADGVVQDIYDKHHLVPFGEYFPLTEWAAKLGLTGMAERVGGGYAAGPGARLLDVGTLGLVLPLICYEAVFAHDVNAAPARAKLIVHVTNDAWFGRAAGPLQHLAQAQMRAIEQGLPVARAANTGVSAMIDPRGRVLVRLGLGQAGFIDAAVPVPLPQTLYARTKDWPMAILFLSGLAFLGLKRHFRNTD